MNSEFNDFLLWEAASRDTIDFKKTYVDVAGGDVLAGLALSEILFWYLPSKTGQSKLRVHHDGHEWIACRRYEWWDRTRFTPRQSDRVLGILESQGLIAIEVYKFRGDPTKHVRLIFDEFYKRWQHFIQHPPQNPFLPKGEIEVTDQDSSIFPKSENEITDSIIPVTENTTKTTTHNSAAPQRPTINPRAIAQRAIPMPQAGRVQEEGEQTTSRQPSSLEMLLAKVTNSRRNSDGIPVLTEKLWKKLEAPVKTKDGTLYPAPSELFASSDLFKQWVRAKITYWQSLEESTKEHLVNLVCAYETGGWLKYQEEQEPDIRPIEGEELEL